MELLKNKYVQCVSSLFGMKVNAGAMKAFALPLTCYKLPELGFIPWWGVS